MSPAEQAQARISNRPRKRAQQALTPAQRFELERLVAREAEKLARTEARLQARLQATTTEKKRFYELFRLGA